MKVCLSCGSPVGPSDTSCPVCQNLLIPITKCPKCNLQFSGNFKYCPKCGTACKVTYAVADIANYTPPELKMVYVRGGEFTMGNEFHGAHTVKLDDFYLANIQVTQSLYKQIMQRNPSKMRGENKPIESITWHDAIIFCNALSLAENKTPCYRAGSIIDLDSITLDNFAWSNFSCDWKANGYRLPTEAEWEYAARGGERLLPFRYSGSNDINEVAWYGENSDITTHDVGMKKPNSLGFYDMSGNVEEWCWDLFENYRVTAQKNPKGAESGLLHVKRGGSWLDDQTQCGVFFRSSASEQAKGSTLGFRLACSTLENKK